MDWRNRPRIGVMGPSRCSERTLDLARRTGACIAREGGILICGGGAGVMEAASRGARESGGMTLGILPGSAAAEANPYVDIPIVTGMGHARNVINVLTSQAIIAISGGPGTLSEIALALKCGTPVIGLGSWRLESPEGQAPPAVYTAHTPEEAVAVALGLIRASLHPSRG
jgi:uncharacterized protein (TIGR00725 family)